MFFIFFHFSCFFSRDFLEAEHSISSTHFEMNNEIDDSLMVRFIARMELTYKMSKPLVHKIDSFKVDVARNEVSQLEVLLY